MATIDDIISRAQQVRDNTAIGSNTAPLVGGVMTDTAEHLKVAESDISTLKTKVNTNTAKLNTTTQKAETALNLAEELSEEGRYIIEGNVTNNPDEVTLTSEDDKLQLKNRRYLASVGGVQGQMGYIILAKGQTFKQQIGAISEGNTIFEIRYDYDLGGEEVSIPGNCTLYFNGGSINGGTLIGNGTNVIADTDSAIFNGVTFSGSFKDSKLVFTNFGAVPDMYSVDGTYTVDGTTYNCKKRTGTDNSSVVTSLCQFCTNGSNIDIYFNGKFYTAVSDAQSISNGNNLVFHGGMINIGFVLSGCSYCSVYDIDFVGFHEAHSFPPIDDYDIYNTSEYRKNAGFAGNCIIFASSAQDVHDCQYNLVENCHVEMRGSGFDIGYLSSPNNVLVHRDCDNSIVRGCTGEYIKFQLCATHGYNNVVSDCKAFQCYQSFDISSYSSHCTLKDCISKSCMTSTKIAGRNVNEGYNTVINLNEHLDDSIQIGLNGEDNTGSVNGFWITNQALGNSSFRNCTITIDREKVYCGVCIGPTQERNIIENITVNGAQPPVFAFIKADSEVTVKGLAINITAPCRYIIYCADNTTNPSIFDNISVKGGDAYTDGTLPAEDSLAANTTYIKYHNSNFRSLNMENITVPKIDITGTGVISDSVLTYKTLVGVGYFNRCTLHTSISSSTDAPSSFYTGGLSNCVVDVVCPIELHNVYKSTFIIKDFVAFGKHVITARSNSSTFKITDCTFINTSATFKSIYNSSHSIVNSNVYDNECVGLMKESATSSKMLKI